MTNDRVLKVLFLVLISIFIVADVIAVRRHNRPVWMLCDVAIGAFLYALYQMRSQRRTE